MQDFSWNGGSTYIFSGPTISKWIEQETKTERNRIQLALRNESRKELVQELETGGDPVSTSTFPEVSKRMKFDHVSLNFSV